jgi:hypothetical protein
VALKQIFKQIRDPLPYHAALSRCTGVQQIHKEIKMYRGLLIQTSIQLPEPMYLMRCTLLQKLQRLSQNQDVKSFQKILDPGTPFDSRMARTKHNGKPYIM